MTKHICNMCGKDFDMWDEQDGLSVRRQAGYGSKFDGSKIDLDLCCTCMEEIIEKCTISPISDT